MRSRKGIHLNTSFSTTITSVKSLEIHNYNNFGHYASSCLLLKLNSVGLSVSLRKRITSPLRAQQVNAIYRFVTMVYDITITILDIIHRSGFYLEHNVSQTVFCLRLQVKPAQLSPIGKASLSPDVVRERLGLSIGPNQIGSA
jgi:hypothetical protein